MSLTHSQKKTFTSYALAIVLFPFLIVMLYPFLFMISATFKTSGGVIYEGFHLIPREFTLEAYRNVFSGTSFEKYFLNSVIVAFFVVAGNIIFAPMAGYAFAKKEFPGKKLLFIMVLGSMMIPIHITLIPLFKMFSQIGWMDTYQVMIVPFLAGAMGIFLMRQYIQGLPSELEQSARIDGCGEMKIYWKIIFPLTRPALAVMIILVFLNSWNNYVWPFIFVADKDMWPLTVGIANFSTYRNAMFNETMVTASIAALPTAVVFIIFQKQIISGMTTGAIKG